MKNPLQGFYEEGYRAGAELPRTSKLYTIACIPDGGRLAVLDLGCGTGENSQLIAAKGHCVCGVDFSANAIERYRRRGFEGHVQDIERGLDFPADRFDVVFCSEVIEHLAAPETLVTGAFRVLKPGGRLILSTPNSAFWIYRLFGLLGWTVGELQHPRHVQFFSRRSLSRLLSAGGFGPVDRLGRNMYLLLPPFAGVWDRLPPVLGFRRETRYRTGRTFWHISNRSRRFNSFFADTLIVVLEKPVSAPLSR